MINKTDPYPSRLDVLERPCITRLDPVVYRHSSGDTSGPLNEEQLAFYEQNGYLLLPDYIEPNLLAQLRQNAARLPAELSPKEDRVITENESKTIRSIFDIHLLRGIFARVCASYPLAGIARQLLGSPVYLHQTRVNYKPGFEGKEFYWHSDFETWHSEDGMPRMRALSCVISLSENYSHNGPLLIIPGSHKLFVACRGKTPEDHYKKSLKKQETGVPAQEMLTMLVEKLGIETMTGPPGTVVFFDCNAMHGSAGNITPYPRHNLFFVYNSSENVLTQPFSGTKPRPDYIASRKFETI